MLETPQGAVDVTVVQEKTRAGGATARTGYSVQSAAPASGPADVVARAQSLWARPLPAEPAAFAHTLAAHLELPPAKVAQALDQAQYNPDVVRLMTPRSARTGRPIVRSWPAYRRRFVEPIRIRDGVAFWRANREMLQQAEALYGVPASIIVAIIGVETVYGRHTGTFPVLDALYTLAFSYPSDAPRDRSAYFREELGEYLAMTLKQGIDPRSIHGSYAGAIGIPQFMPGSIRRYAVGTINRDAPDLIGKPSDAILSVANYLAAHGWRPGLPVFAPVRLPPSAHSLAQGGLEPTLTWSELAAAGAAITGQETDRVARQANTPGGVHSAQANPSRGIESSTSIRVPSRAGNLDWTHAPLAVIDLPYGSNKPVEYRVATPNFFAITHYNRSYFYATAVAELADAIERALLQ